MAYTTPVIDIYGGKASCYLVDPANTADTAPHDNPLSAANIARVIFHSDLPYYKALLDQSITWTLPVRNNAGAGAGTERVFDGVSGKTFQYFDHYPFGTVSAAEVPKGYLVYASAPLTGTMVVQSQLINLTSSLTDTIYRLIGPVMSVSGLALREYWGQYVSGAYNITWPSLSLGTIRGVAFGTVSASPTADLIDFNGATGSFQFGKLLIDAASSGRLMRETAGGIPVTPDRTIDFSSTGMRIWNPVTGGYSDVGTYSGSYAGPTRRFIA